MLPVEQLIWQKGHMKDTPFTTGFPPGPQLTACSQSTAADFDSPCQWGRISGWYRLLGKKGLPARPRRRETEIVPSPGSRGGVDGRCVVEPLSRLKCLLPGNWAASASGRRCETCHPPPSREDTRVTCLLFRPRVFSHLTAITCSDR